MESDNFRCGDMILVLTILSYFAIPVLCVTHECPASVSDISYVLTTLREPDNPKNWPQKTSESPNINLGFRPACSFLVYVNSAANDLPAPISLIFNRQNICGLRKTFLSLINLVKCVDLGHNELRALDCEAFTIAKHLSVLLLVNNRINQILVQPKECVSSAKILDMSRNQMTHLQRNQFKNWPNLRVLRLSSNLISEIAGDAFAGLTQLKYLFLDGNPILYLGLSLNPLKSLTLLNVSNSQLTDLPELPTGLSILSSRSAQIRDLSFNLAPNLSEFKLVELERNPWNCTCRLFYVLSAIRSVKDFSNLICSTPSHLTGLSIPEADAALNCSIIPMEPDTTEIETYVKVSDKGLKTFLLYLAAGIAAATIFMAVYIVCLELRKCRKFRVNPQNIEAMDWQNHGALECRVNDDATVFINRHVRMGHSEIYHARPVNVTDCPTAIHDLIDHSCGDDR